MGREVESVIGVVAVPPFSSSEGCIGSARRFCGCVQLPQSVAAVAEVESGASSPARCLHSHSVSSEGGSREVPAQVVMPDLEEEFGAVLPDWASGKGLHRCTDSREGHSLEGRSREVEIGVPREEEIGCPQRIFPLIVPVVEEADSFFVPIRVLDQGFHRLALSSESLSLAGRS